MPSGFLRNTETIWLLRSCGIFCLRIILHIFVILHVNGFQDVGEDSRLVNVILLKDNPFVCWKFYILKNIQCILRPR